MQNTKCCKTFGTPVFKFTFILFIGFVVTPLDAVCRKKQKSSCANGQAPLAGYFCGRDPNRQDCPSTHECLIAPNDAYAVCCPLSQQTVTQPAKEMGKPSLCPQPSIGFGACFARCSTDTDCVGDLKCCGNCPRDCMNPVL